MKLTPTKGVVMIGTGKKYVGSSANDATLVTTTKNPISDKTLSQ